MCISAGTHTQVHDNAKLLDDSFMRRSRSCHRQPAILFACAGNHIRTEGAVELDHNLSLWGT